MLPAYLIFSSYDLLISLHLQCIYLFGGTHCSDVKVRIALGENPIGRLMFWLFPVRQQNNNLWNISSLDLIVSTRGDVVHRLRN